MGAGPYVGSLVGPSDDVVDEAVSQSIALGASNVAVALASEGDPTVKAYWVQRLNRAVALLNNANEAE